MYHQDTIPKFQDILNDFAFFDDWMERYRYLIDIGEYLACPDPHLTLPANKIEGCVSQVWLHVERLQNGHLSFVGASDSQLVRGLVVILLALFSNKSPKTILDINTHESLAALNLTYGLTPQRTNGLQAMVERIRLIAARELIREDTANSQAT